MSRRDQASLERWVREKAGLAWWGLDFEIKLKLRAAYYEYLDASPPALWIDDAVALWVYRVYGAYFFECSPQHKVNWRHLYKSTNS